MPQYMLTVFQDYDEAIPPDVVEKVMAQTGAHQAALKAAGVWLFAGSLTPPGSATVVRATDSGATMTDGPYAETKEQIGGFTVIDVADLDEALEWARTGSEACLWPVEVRPFSWADHP